MINKSAFIADTDNDYIKKRKGREGRSYQYIEWTYANWRLIQATGNNYNFETISQDIINVAPLTRTKKINGKKVSVEDSDGNPVRDAQSPVVVIHGRLSIPEMGYRENFGSAVLQGSSDQWGDAFKAAASDCFKKCCSMFGIGLDLTGDVPEWLFDDDEEDEEEESKKEENTEVAESGDYDFDEDDVEELKNLMDELEIGEEKIGEFIDGFSNGQLSQLEDITKDNIKGFNAYLREMLEE